MRQTNDSEWFNTARTSWVSWLVWEALSGAQRLANHIGAITGFIYHNNLEKAAALPV
jgi:hypothetical protein